MGKPDDEPAPEEPRPCAADAGLSRPVDTSDDIFGFDGCRPAPARFIVLGDSIAGCWGVSQASCSPNLIAESVRRLASPDLVVESHAIFGSGVEDLPREANLVAPGPGHVYVWVFSVGNDLLAGLALPGSDLTGVEAAMGELLAYFTDETRFPDGVTFLLNGQYGPFDQCDVPGAAPGYSPERAARLREVNQILFLDAAETRPDTVAIDHYPDWLGHGTNANLFGCPYCGRDNTRWNSDTIHPDEIGHAHIAAKWDMALEQMLGPACRNNSGSP